MARLQPGTRPFRLEGIDTPTANTDAANKAYVDASATSEGIQTYANSTAYSVGDVVYNPADTLIYRVRTAVAASNTQAPPGNSSFEKIGFLTSAEADSNYQPLAPTAEGLVSTLPTGNVATSARAQSGAIQIRSSSNLNSSNQSWGFFDQLDFGNFPASTEVYSQLTATTEWGDLFSGAYRYMAINFGSALPTSTQSALFAGSLNEVVIELLGYVSDTNYAIWHMRGYSGGAEGNLFYLGRKQPELITSQGRIGTNDARWMFNITNTDPPTISQFSTQITNNEDVLLSDNRYGKVGTPQLLDDGVTRAKLGSDLTTPNLGLSQATDGGLRLSPAFVDAASVLALSTRYQLELALGEPGIRNNTPGNMIISRVSQNFSGSGISTGNPASWDAVRSVILTTQDGSNPGRSIAGLGAFFGPGSILELHVLDNNTGARTGAYAIYSIGEFTANFSNFGVSAVNIPATYGDSGSDDEYGASIYTGMLPGQSSGTPATSDNQSYEVILHGRQRARDGRTILPGTIRNGALADDTVDNSKLANMGANTVKVNATSNSTNPTDLFISPGHVLGRDTSGNINSLQVTEGMLDISTAPANGRVLGYVGTDMSWLKNIEGIYEGVWRRINRENNNTDGTLAAGDIAFLDSYVSAGSGTGHYSSTGDAWSSVSYVSINPTEYVSSGTGADARISTSRLRVGSHIKVTQNGTGNFVLLELTSRVSEAEFNTFWAVNVVSSSGNIPSQTTNLTVYLQTATDLVVNNDHILDNSIGGQKLNITDVSTRTTNVLYRNEDNGRLEQGEYAVFAANTDGVVPAYASGAVPDWSLIHSSTTVKTDPLAYDTSGNNLTDNTRSWQVTYAGNVQTTRPSTWIDVFGDPDVPDTLDDVVTFEDNNSTFAAESAAGRNALIADNAVNRNGAGARVFVYTDKDNWAYVQLQNNSHSVFQSTTFGLNTFLLIESSRVGGSGAEARSVQVIAQKGVPGNIVTFVFPRDTSGNLLTNLVRIGGDDDVLTTNGWEVKEEYNHSDPVQIFALWAEGEVITGGVTYNSSNLPVLVRKEVHVGDSVLQYTGSILYNSSNLPTSTVIYNGDFSTVASLQSSHVIATKAITYNSDNLPTGTTIT